MCNYRFRRLGEDDRTGRNGVGRTLACIKAALGELLRVGGVIFPHTEQVAGGFRNLGEQPYFIQAQCGGIRLEQHQGHGTADQLDKIGHRPPVRIGKRQHHIIRLTVERYACGRPDLGKREFLLFQLMYQPPLTLIVWPVM